MSPSFWKTFLLDWWRSPPPPGCMLLPCAESVPGAGESHRDCLMRMKNPTMIVRCSGESRAAVRGTRLAERGLAGGAGDISGPAPGTAPGGPLHRRRSGLRFDLWRCARAKESPGRGGGGRAETVGQAFPPLQSVAQGQLSTPGKRGEDWQCSRLSSKAFWLALCWSIGEAGTWFASPPPPPRVVGRWVLQRILLLIGLG